MSASLFAGSMLWAGESPADPVVELPKFVVTDARELPPPEAWRYTEIPGFEVLTNASDRSTQRLLKDFLLFKQALGYVFPVRTRTAVPTTLILCGRGAKFDAFVPDGKATTDTGRASLFLKGRDQSAIVIDFEARAIEIGGADDTDDVATGTDSSRIDIDHNKQLYREYVHYLLSQNEPRPPAWLEEGVAQIIMAMKFDATSIYFGQLEDPNTISAEAALVASRNAAVAADDPDAVPLPGAPAEDRDFNAALHRKALVPMDQFFAVTHDSPEAINPLGNNRWAKQAYAFVHLCIYGENGRYQKSFGQFLSRLGREPVSEAVFKDCFKMSYQEMLLTLRGYIDFTVYKSIEFNAKKGQRMPEPPPVVLRDATQSEVGRIKGEALVLAGHPASARTELIAPFIRGERDPRLLAALGLYEHSGGQDERARKFLDAAAAAKVVRPGAYLQIARFRYADALAAPAAAGGRLSAEQAKGVFAPLLVARTQPPPSPEVYELLADTWLHSAAKPQRNDIGLLAEGVQIFPGRLRLVYATASLSRDAGLADTARSLIEYGLSVAPDAKTRGLFEQLQTSLPGPVPKP